MFTLPFEGVGCSNGKLDSSSSSTKATVPTSPASTHISKKAALFSRGDPQSQSYLSSSGDPHSLISCWTHTIRQC